MAKTSNQPLSAIDDDEVDSQPGTANTWAIYLRQARQHPMLPAQDQLNLARKWGEGRKAQKRLAAKRGELARAERARLNELVRIGLEARGELIASNWRLVIKVAHRYLKSGLSLGDLTQEGNVGLLIAADKFDPKRGFNFSTYATWWVRQSISRAVAEKSRAIRLPVYMSDQLRAYHRESARLTQVLGHEPSFTDLTDHQAEIGWSEMQLKNAAWADQCQTVSLDAPLDENAEDGTTWADMVPDTSPEADPTFAALNSLNRDRLYGILRMVLPEREQNVLAMRFGLHGGKAATLEEVGLKIGVTRERVRQIEKVALTRLRQPTVLRQLQAVR